MEKEVTRVVVRYQGGLQFAGIGEVPTAVSLMDAGKDENGNPKGPFPMEMLLFGLGGCTGMDMVTILVKKRQKLTGLEMNIAGDREEKDPKRFTAIHIEYVVRGKGLNEKAVTDAIRLSEDKYCSARACFNCPVTSSFTIVEE